MTRLDPHPADYCKVVNAIDADAYTAGTVTATDIDTRGFEYALVIVDIGTMGSSATLDVKVQHSATSGGTYADITGAAITQAVDATDDDTVKAGIVRLHGVNRFIEVEATSAVAAVDYSVTVILIGPGASADQSFSYDFDV